MRHYYNDNGTLAYLPPTTFKAITTPEQLQKFVDEAHAEFTYTTAYYLHQIYCANQVLDEYGDTGRLRDWFRKAEDSILEDVLKELLGDFAARVDVHGEFMLAATAFIGNLASNSIVLYEEDPEEDEE